MIKATSVWFRVGSKTFGMAAALFLLLMATAAHADMQSGVVSLGGSKLPIVMAASEGTAVRHSLCLKGRTALILLVSSCLRGIWIRNGGRPCRIRLSCFTNS